VAKGVCRQQIIYAKHHLEVTLRAMFLKMTEWYVGVVTNFTVSFGEYGKNIERYIAAELYQKILSTYPDSDPEKIWNSLFIMTEIFSELALKVAEALNFEYDKQEEVNVIQYLKEIYRKRYNPQ
jgi:aminoglycoside 6-adenylyltransferase